MPSKTALEYTETEHADGVGFVFTDDDPIVGVDLDDCRDPETGDVDDAAQRHHQATRLYTEVSPSGTGYHVLITGELPRRTEPSRERRTVRHGTFSPSLATTSMRLSVALHVDRTRSQRFTAVRPGHRRDTASESEPGNGTDDQSTATGTADVDVDLEDEDLLRKRETRRTARSSSSSGTGIRSATTVSPKPIWPCVVCWRSGPVATGRR